MFNLANLWVIERICVAWFITEFVLTFWCQPNKCDYVLDFFGIADWAAIIPYFLVVICNKYMCVVKNYPDGDGLLAEPLFPTWMFPVSVAITAGLSNPN